MSTLREQMVHHMQLRGLSQRTQEAYVRAMLKLAQHYGISPDQLTEEQVRNYLLYLKNKGGANDRVGSPIMLPKWYSWLKRKCYRGSDVHRRQNDD